MAGSYRAGVGVALLTSFLSVWTTIVRDDGNAIGYFFVILAAGVGAFAAWFQPAGVARSMLGAAAMQALLGIAIATAPITASVADGPFKALLFNSAFAVLWLISAALFRAAARGRRVSPSPAA